LNFQAAQIIGKGFFLCKNKPILIKINFEDHLQVVGMRSGGRLEETYLDVKQTITSLEESLQFATHERLGFITRSPYNLGSIRVEATLEMPKVKAEEDELQTILEEYNLDVTYESEDLNPSAGFIRLATKKLLGQTNYQAVSDMKNALDMLVRLEQNL